MRRTVWDGDREFYEIQMPGGDGSAHLERDVWTLNQPRETAAPSRSTRMRYRVNVFDGRGLPSENRLRDAVFRASDGRSFTMGYNIYLSDRDIGNMAILAHEMTHVWQFATWGRGRHVGRGIGARVKELRGGDPYELPDLGQSVLGFHE